MALLLNIDTATEMANISVTQNGECLGFKKNDMQKDHASFLHIAVEAIMQDIGKHLHQLDAVSVTNGPGSYTGLRVGLSAAKGFCYALNKPLITLNTLAVMARGALETLVTVAEDQLFCPMIDARRLEVFTAVYNFKLQELYATTHTELNNDEFLQFLDGKNVLFFASGNTKFKSMVQQPNFVFVNLVSFCGAQGMLAEEAFDLKKFADVTYVQPAYYKEFYSVKPGHIAS